MSAEQQKFEPKIGENYYIEPAYEEPPLEEVPVTALDSFEEPSVNHEPDIENENSMDSRPARRGRGSRAARRGVAPAALPTPAPSPVPEAATTASSEGDEAPKPSSSSEAPAEEPRRIYNQGTIPEGIEATILGRKSPETPKQNTQTTDQTARINNAIAAYAAKNDIQSLRPAERPDTSGPRNSYRVELNELPISPRINPEGTSQTSAPETEAPKAPEISLEEVKPHDSSDADEAIKKARDLSAEVEAELAGEPAQEPVSTPEPATTPPAPVAPEPRRKSRQDSGDLYTQLGLAEKPLATSRDDLRGASRGGLETTGVPVLSSREIRDRNSSASSATAPETSEPEPGPRARRRHARREGARPLDRMLGYTSGRPEVSEPEPSNPDNEATQPIPIVTQEEASATTEPERRRGITQRLRGRIGQIATRMGIRTNEERALDWEIRRDGLSNGLEPGEARPFRLATEEERNRPRTNLRRRALGTIGLVAASAGLMLGASGDMSHGERPNAAISASQIPGQSAEGKRVGSIASNLTERAREAAADAADNITEQVKKARQNQSVDSDTTKPETANTNNEKITLGKDGTVTVELREGGTYWEGVQEAEQLLDIDDSATATANAVNTIGFEEGEDRTQKVGAKVTFKNVGGKLVASRG